MTQGSEDVYVYLSEQGGIVKKRYRAPKCYWWHV